VGPAAAPCRNLARELRATGGVSVAPHAVHIVHDEDPLIMDRTRALPISVHHLERLIAHALGDLKQARRADNAYAARRAEQRMNALLDQLRTKVIHMRPMP